MVMVRRHYQRRPSMTILRINIRSILQQTLHDFNTIIPTGNKKNTLIRLAASYIITTVNIRAVRDK